MVIQLKLVICRQLLGGLRGLHALLSTLSSYKLQCSIRANLQTSYTLRGVPLSFVQALTFIKGVEYSIYTTLMGSSNMDIMTIGDVEGQQHNPNWYVDHKHMLRPNQESVVNKLGYFILKVPECTRQPPQAFSPQGWRFGLHNRENLDSGGSKAVKLAIAVLFGLVGEKWVRFCDAIVDDPRATLASYGLHNEVTTWIDEHIKHVLALDALFLATYLDMQFPKNERRLWTRNSFPFGINANDVFYAKYGTWVGILCSDLFRVENQIPLVLIGKAVEYISNSVSSPTFEGNESFSGDLQYQQRCLEYAMDKVTTSFMDTSSEAFKIDNSSLFGQKMHILGAAYRAICGSKGLNMKRVRRSAYICVPSAIMLKHSGIQIVGIDGPLSTMSYKKNCLCLPKMSIYDETFSFIRNMAWYEKKSIPGGVLFHDYILFVAYLIQTPEDLDLLMRRGVIDNACGFKGFEMWIALQEGLTQISTSKIYYDMKIAIVRRCGLRRYRLWSEFKIIFCSKPWVVLSTIVVVLVMMATLVQTYIAIIGSHKMKPKFP